MEAIFLLCGARRPQLMRNPLASAMKSVLTTTDRSHVESVRLALEGADIPTVIADTSGSALPFLPVSVLVEDAHYDRAQLVIRDTVLTPRGGESRSPWYRRSSRWLILLLVALGLLLCGSIFIG